MKAFLKSQKRNRTTYIDTSLISRTMTVFEFIPSFFAWSFSLRFLEVAVFQGSFCIASNLYILYGHLRLLRLATCNSSSTSELTNWDPSAPSRSVASRNCASCLWTGGGLWRRSEIWWTFDGHFACGFRVFRYSLLKEKSERKVIKWLFWWFFLCIFVLASRKLRMFALMYCFIKISFHQADMSLAIGAAWSRMCTQGMDSWPH